MGLGKAEFFGRGTFCDSSGVSYMGSEIHSKNTQVDIVSNRYDHGHRQLITA